MIRGIHHTSISTTNAAALLTFYRDLVGLEEVHDLHWETGSQPELDKVVGMARTAGRAILLRASNTYVEIFEYTNPHPEGAPMRPACDAGIRHLCFDVIDIDAEYDRLSRAGISFHCAPQRMMGVKATYGRDPDGNIFELQEVLPGEGSDYLALDLPGVLPSVAGPKLSGD